MKRFALVLAFVVSAHAANWPNWRGGVDGSGVTTEKDLPLTWSATENVSWKQKLPDRGNSTPIVWGGKIFVTQAVEKANERALMCFSAADGKVLWRQAVVYGKAEETHPTNPYCSASPTTDGERVIVCHGSAGVFCYDLEGKEVWRRDLGRQEYEWGNASSPVIHGDLCFLYFGPGKGAQLLALDKKTGKDVWRYEEKGIDASGRTDGFRGSEPGMICTYATPILVNTGGREELIMLFPKFIRAFEPKTGKELWHCDGMNPLIYASPISDGSTVIGMGGFNGTTIAVPTGGSGDMTGNRLWQSVRTKNRLGSGIIYEGHVYVLNTEGFAECIELQTGKTVYLERVKSKGPKGDSWSSMVRSGDRIYILNQSGDCYVLRASPKFEVLATNGLGSELTNASLAVSDGRLFIRTHEHLYCIAK
jgi:outer membrane protein assembly factor BamB